MVKNRTLIFTIPFHFENEYKVIEKELDANGKWNAQNIVGGENDLFNYISSLISITTDDKSIARSWALKNEIIGESIFKKKKLEYSWRVQDVGIVVFRTNIAILWYKADILVPENQDISPEELIKYIYALKEYSYKGVDIKIINGKEIKMNRFYEDFIMPLINNFKIDDFYANRWINKKTLLIPDRALVFSSVYEIGDVDIEEQLYMNSYHLGRVYDLSYKMSPLEKDNNFYRGFEDSIWYTSREGCNNYLCTKEENKFYASTYLERINTYFYLYILCLGQYYSLLELAHEVSVLSTDEEMYSSNDNRLESLMDQIHIFNLKNNYSQVGHLTQHNEFYEYLQKRLGINKMQQELEVELRALFEMIERKKAIKQEKNYQVLSIIGGIFVVLQAFINVAAMYGSAINGEWEYFVFATGGCVILAIIGVIIWSMTLIKRKR